MRTESGLTRKRFEPSSSPSSGCINRLWRALRMRTASGLEIKSGDSEVIENMVARDGVEPLTPAFSGSP